MLKYGVGLIVRAFVELGLVFFLFGAMLVFVAYRIGRLFVTPEPDKLDRLAMQLGRALGLAAAARAGADDLGSDDPGAEQVDYLGELDWREVVTYGREE